jgi:hypothetical protein
MQENNGMEVRPSISLGDDLLLKKEVSKKAEAFHNGGLLRKEKVEAFHRSGQSKLSREVWTGYERAVKRLGSMIASPV